MKYQQRIHKAFAEHLNKDAKKKAAERLEELRKQFPELAQRVNETDFYADGVMPISTDNITICEYFSRDTPHIGPNVQAYRTIERYAKTETNPEYKKVYKALMSAYKKYFSLAAEDTLTDYYGDTYKDFVAKESAKIEAEMKAAADRRKATMAENAANSDK